MLITLAGRFALAAACTAGANAWARKNGVLALRSSTLSQPRSGNSSKLRRRHCSREYRLSVHAQSRQRPVLWRHRPWKHPSESRCRGPRPWIIPVRSHCMARPCAPRYRPLCNEPFGDHFADAARAAGHQRNVPFSEKSSWVLIDGSASDELRAGITLPYARAEAEARMREAGVGTLALSNLARSARSFYCFCPWLAEAIIDCS